jgi:hypothetical protein
MRPLRFLHSLNLSGSRRAASFLIKSYFVRRRYLHIFPDLGVSRIPKDAALKERFEPRMIYLQGQVMAKSSSGYMYPVPSEARKGDRLWILEGAKVRFVPRPADDGKAWRIVGEAHAHGIMADQA